MCIHSHVPGGTSCFPGGSPQALAPAEARKDGALEASAPVEGVGPGSRGQRQLVEMFRKMRAAPQPIIAMVHGAACGAGFGLVLAADIRLVTPQARALWPGTFGHFWPSLPDSGHIRPEVGQLGANFD